MTTYAPAPAPVHSAQLVTPDGRTLPLRSTRLHVTAGAGLARTRLEQRFANPHAEPLTVTYQLPLPADGAVAAFTFVVGERRIVGEIDGRQAARERLERALTEGKSGALVEQDRTALFAQTIGNIPPGTEVQVELTVDQPLRWQHRDEWEYRFPTTVAPRYLGAEGRVPDAGRITVDVASAPLPPRLTLELRIDDHLAAGAAATSPSHTLTHDGANVALPAEGVRLDRDLVVRWQVGTPEVGAELITARPGADAPHGDIAYGLLTLVPPNAATTAVPRDLTVLLDTSGSMNGEPLQQAKAVVAALLDGLTDQDQVQLIEFSTAPRRWRSKPVRATAKERQQAQRWLQGLQASGGTEMHSAVLESLTSLRDDAQHQVLLVTDGLIGFEREIVQALLQRLPGNCRFHVLGVGPASNRSLSSAVARAGRGVEAIVGLGEDPAAAAQRLDARLRAPVVVDLELTGPALLATAPARLPDLFAGEPARLSLRLDPKGGVLEVRGHTAAGPFARRLEVPAIAPATGRPEVVTRCGRELVEDLELQAAADASIDVDARVEALGRHFRLATRCTSWVAISTEPTVDPQAPVRRERIPHELPHGLSAEAFGLRAPQNLWLTLAAPGAARSRSGVMAAEEGHALRHDKVEQRRGGGMLYQRGLFPVEPPRPVVRGPATLRWRRDGSIALEFALDGERWELPSQVQLHWPDGIVRTVTIDAARSTRPGTVAAGAVVRLVLQVPPDAPATAPIAVELHSTRIEVVVAS